MSDQQNTQLTQPQNRSQYRLNLVTGTVLMLVVILISYPLATWQRINIRRTGSMANIRRLTSAAQLYAEDSDDRIPAPVRHLSNGVWLTWPMVLNGYGASPTWLQNPSNPISSVDAPVKAPEYNYNIVTSYALNRRFNDTFAPGAFLVDNLELPNQTALFVEAGPMWSCTGRGEHDIPSLKPIARLDYGDTMDRYESFFPYPSTHTGKMVVSAADGHASTVTVQHYSAEDGPHDPLYGRIGGDIYNWNGGHLNGSVDLSPRE